VFRTPFAEPDQLTERASNPDFDALVMGVGNGSLRQKFIAHLLKDCADRRLSVYSSRPLQRTV
jgi:hypothetical protein